MMKTIARWLSGFVNFEKSFAACSQLFDLVRNDPILEIYKSPEKSPPTESQLSSRMMKSIARWLSGFVNFEKSFAASSQRALGQRVCEYKSSDRTTKTTNFIFNLKRVLTKSLDQFII